ncbi:GNAT family N-acetyltransferase [Zophobihabitans entericus]|uniref:tRNA(Met) cytidine acetyltransferase TmcA n=1 Tax=Zophobihabitans entericus TaxID=1635327 RepID=A0A6G9IDL2_9GAMM|nr:GNAT family N-acetyltransferase [Zophobihabitans entericus]QIQ21927.1 tRNA(Met) cytidine acetyltransferase [Zophobihabitans entericus]
MNLPAHALNRQLIILQGQPSRLYADCRAFISHITGDWITLSYQSSLPNVLSPEQAKKLLGQEFKHAIFDATEGFNLDAFVILAGTLSAGSVCLLLLPENPAQCADIDSLRWNESPEPIQTPNFYTYLQQIIACTQTLVIPSGSADILQLITQVQQNNQSVSAQNLGRLTPSAEQQQILDLLKVTNKPAVILTAKRGRGKSALAGLFTWQKFCWITAPNRQATGTLHEFAKPGTPFFAPDCLINEFHGLSEKPEWLIIDEAAMIPLPLLLSLITLGSKVLLTTTIDGYEGTGQGFVLKLLPQLKQDYAWLTLQAPMRWSDDDSLEHFVDSLLMNNFNQNKELHNKSSIKSIGYNYLKQGDLIASQPNLTQIYQLLKQAHYRTSPVDLRRLLDAGNIHISTANSAQTVGVILSIAEGGLSPELAQAVWAGIRRPKGNLVAQSLAAHAGVQLAAELKSWRVNRIAVTEEYRRQGIAKHLIRQHIQLAQEYLCDFVSVSFAYTTEMEEFWTACGFTVVHIGSHKEASSGCYAAMAIYPLTPAGDGLQQKLAQNLARNWFWQRDIIELSLPIEIDTNQKLDQQDIELLSGFAAAFRPLEGSYAMLCRLINTSELAEVLSQYAPVLCLLLKEKKTEQQVIALFHLTGKNELIQAMRREAGQILQIIEGRI